MKKKGRKIYEEDGKREEEGEAERCESVGLRKKKKEERIECAAAAAAAAAAAVGDPHSLAYKVVTLDTSQSPMGWLSWLA